MQNYNDTIESFVINSGLATRHDVSESLGKANKMGVDLGSALFQSGKISEDDLSRIYAKALGIPFVNLDESIPLGILSVIPEPIARKQNIVAYNRHEDGVEVAILNLNSLETLVGLQQNLGIKFYPRFTTKNSIKKGLISYQKKLKDHFGEKIQKGLSEESSISTKSIIKTLVHHAVIQNASDIHVEPREESLSVRYRILGSLNEAMILPLSSGIKISKEIKNLCGLNADIENLPQEGKFTLDEEGHSLSVRVSIFPIFYGEKITMRLAGRGTGGFSLEGLGCVGKTLEDINTAFSKRRGLVIFAGKPRSGISTTLYSSLDVLNNPNYSISTIEDSIEYNISRANQSLVKEEIGFTKDVALRSALKQDPDIVMVSSCNTPSILDVMTNASRSGKLVIGSMSADGAANALINILSTSNDPENLLDQLEVVTYQRLVKRLSDSKEKYFLSEAGLKALDKIVDSKKVLEYMKEEKIVSSRATWKNIPFYRPVFSKNSSGGYKGSVGLFESIPITNAMRNKIKEDFTINTVMREANKENFISIIEDGVIKAVQGLTTLDEVIRAAS